MSDEEKPAPQQPAPQQPSPLPQPFQTETVERDGGDRGGEKRVSGGE